MKNPQTIGFFGDSFVTGVSDPEGLGWVGRICQADNLRFKNFGVQGDTSEDVLARWRKQAEAARCSALVFSFGANDCLNGDNRRPRVGQLDRLKNTKTILSAAKQMGPTLLVSPLPIADDEKITDRIADTARQLTTIARANGVLYANIFEDVRASSVWREEALAGDGAHPGAAGYAHVADILSQNSVWRDWVSRL
ncbi:MAG: hypothetical protein JJ850_05010 [Kordiimonadaceae bacterium]|nr:hypothetical protein [Kordiimonadaceae bacterium]MBO6568319.1 hypothetical protein [Kordiimonadaceae bacterium]MBO6963951.1 hypothetical protein [Kordiimonadaceae bacterium]